MQRGFRHGGHGEYACESVCVRGGGGGDGERII